MLREYLGRLGRYSALLRGAQARLRLKRRPAQLGKIARRVPVVGATVAALADKLLTAVEIRSLFPKSISRRPKTAKLVAAIITSNGIQSNPLHLLRHSMGS